jgi:hypothetical protein
MKGKFIFAFIVVLLGCYLVYFTPKIKYQGKAVVTSLMDSVPEMFGRWRGQDIPVKNDAENPMYNFLSKAFARFYYDLYLPDRGVSLMVLDAGNFHYPKICMTGAGGKTDDLEPRVIEVGGHKVKAYLVFTEYENRSVLTVYWICIDKKVVKDWLEQKVKQLFFSLFNTKAVGLMVRADIRVTRDNVDDGVKYAEKFFNDLYGDLPRETKDYMFGV